MGFNTIYYHLNSTFPLLLLTFYGNITNARYPLAKSITKCFPTIIYAPCHVQLVRIHPCKPLQ